MKIIKELSELIEEEISDMKKYAKMASEVKDHFPNLAQVLYVISTQEDGHRAAIHEEVTKIIEHHRKMHGEPPADMMAVYEYLHKRSVEKLEEARRYQEIYRGM